MPFPSLAPPSGPRAPLAASRRGPRRYRRPWWRVSLPWTIHVYLLTEILRVFLLGVLAVSLLYTVVAAYETVRSGIQLSFIWPLLTKTFAYPLYYSIPLSLLFSITLAIGRMSSDLEIAALRTHGVSHLQIFTPILALGAVMSAVSFHMNGWVVPNIHYEKRNLQAYILEQLKSLGSGVNRTILLPEDTGTLWVGAYRDTELWQVDIDLALHGRSQVLPEIRGRLPEQLPEKVKILARQGKLELHPERMAVVLNLRGVDVLVPEPVRGATVANERFHQMFSITENVVIPLSFAPKSPSTKDRTHPELLQYIAELREEDHRLRLIEKEGLTYAAHKADASEKKEAGGTSQEKSRKQVDRKLASARTELHRRIAFSLSCLTFPLLAVSLTLLLQGWSRIVPFFFGNLIAISIYYPLLMVGVTLGESGFFPPVAMALPNIALLAIGVFFTRKVIRQ